MTRCICAKKLSFAFPILRSPRRQHERRIVLTFDRDFGDILAAARNEVPSIIIFRLRNQTPAAVNLRLFRVIAECEGELVGGAIVIVEDVGYRVRRLPIRH